MSPGLIAAAADARKVIRRNIVEILESVTIRDDPARISRNDWAEIADDLAALRALDAHLPPADDEHSAFLARYLPHAPKEDAS
ncbi:MAG: hypothetical protein Tsb0020_55970 [Haliangiales bacterium]